MLAILRTICGAERIVELPYRDRHLDIPYAETRSARHPSNETETPLFMRRTFRDTGLVEHRKLEGYTTSPRSNGEVQLRVFLEEDALAPLVRQLDGANADNNKLRRQLETVRKKLRETSEAAGAPVHVTGPTVPFGS